MEEAQWKLPAVMKKDVGCCFMEGFCLLDNVRSKKILFRSST
jgi:hypothetical protein